jgi:D-3-phosphoglycerate dehydrogenase / 2-oxoglutarate reductase
MDEVTGRIAVTPRSLSAGGHPALAPLAEAGYEVVFPAPGRQPTLEEQAAVLPGCVGYLAGVEPVPGKLLRACPHLRVISRNGAGTDNVDLDVAAELGIAVERTAGANAEGVAELAIALMLASVRRLAWSDATLKSGAWSRKRGIELRGRRLGVVGTGQIGRRVTEMGIGLGMTVRAYDPYPDEGFAPSGDFAYTTVEEVLGQSDVVSLHCPPGPTPLIDRSALAGFQPGAHLVNTARSAVVDERAVEEALESGHLGGYATDVFDTEPPQMTPLLRRDDVVITPHAGGFTSESVERATRGAVDNLLRVLGER